MAASVIRISCEGYDITSASEIHLLRAGNCEELDWTHVLPEQIFMGWISGQDTIAGEESISDFIIGERFLVCWYERYKEDGVAIKKPRCSLVMKTGLQSIEIIERGIPLQIHGTEFTCEEECEIDWW